MTDHTAQLFSISGGSATPIYRQLVEQVKRLAAAGVLAPGDGLPSVRDVAQELAVNPMTVSKAYGLLEMDGVLTRLRGQGMQVARRRGHGKGEREALLRPALEKAAREARELELDDRTILELFQLVLKETT
ncbi:GntR family transcriptional regulator [Pseudoduganella lurida]|uniref:GntR family transcriptional regulator n=1 Tax=Pseudoduganella lurida TaxID=1036180 RepID=A0A562RF62_9BURK|nr:GntR family transcriptional regulator [Pseudoduganella lurida]TWI67543.1 GntR family transcriptional regulator [Pseudoduganella lurida]